MDVLILLSLCTASLCILYFFDYLCQRASCRQFYRDLVRLVILREQYDFSEYLIKVPKILGPRIIRYSSYEAVLKDLFSFYETGSTNFSCVLALVFSLYPSYCYSDRDMLKFKNKLLKEKQNETHQDDRNP